AVADLSPTKYRGSAYGIFNTFYGLGFLFSGSIFGLFLSGNMVLLGILYTLITEALAIAILLKSVKIL
ncbi:MFS transporter, partial [Candidatus Geothermarchaeota archaeon]